MGNKAVPTALRMLRGNPSQRPIPDIALPPSTLSPPPRELKGDNVARKEWRRLEPLLRGARILTDADRAALVAACRQWSRYVAAERQLTEGGLLVPAGPRSKHKIPSPYLSIANKTLELCVKLWTELGLTPSARTRVEVARTPPAQATLDTFLKSS